MTGFACELGVGFGKREQLWDNTWVFHLPNWMMVAISETGNTQKMRSWIVSHEFTFVQGDCEASLSSFLEDINCSSGMTGPELTAWLWYVLGSWNVLWYVLLGVLGGGSGHSGEHGWASPEESRMRGKRAGGQVLRDLSIQWTRRSGWSGGDNPGECDSKIIIITREKAF